ncbi:hypothetical protein QYF36_013510 [Acer negundo]|nr:hypothetical protein QYF36_013510 [Acer negundo]
MDASFRKLETLLNQINDALQKQDNGKSLRNNEHVKAFEASYDELQKDEKEEKEETSSELIKDDCVDGYVVKIFLIDVLVLMMNELKALENEWDGIKKKCLPRDVSAE